MKKIPALLCCACLITAVSACHSTGKKKETDETRENSALSDPDPVLEIGGYYKLGGALNAFYFTKPNFTDVLGNRYLKRGTIVQLLDPTAGDGWARVKTADLDIGYIHFEAIKIVPYDKQPKPKNRDPEAELDKRMGVQ